MSVDDKAMEQAVSSLLSAIGEDPDREGLLETPRRVAQLYRDLFSGLHMDADEVLSTSFDEGHRELVVLKDVPFFSVCEHHLMPFFGTADIGYVPSGRVVGASKLARALDILARRPQVQERLAGQLVDAIMGNKDLRPQGASAVLSAEHLCLTLRGVRKPGSRIVTRASRGTLKTQGEARSEFLAIVSGG